jgi:hypothetical protein
VRLDDFEEGVDVGGRTVVVDGQALSATYVCEHARPARTAAVPDAVAKRRRSLPLGHAAGGRP